MRTAAKTFSFAVVVSACVSSMIYIAHNFTNAGQTLSDVAAKGKMVYMRYAAIVVGALCVVVGTLLIHQGMSTWTGLSTCLVGVILFCCLGLK